MTVNEIIKESNSSKGSFYLHFGSKHQIFMEKFKEIDAHYTDYIKTLPPQMPAPEKILLFIGDQMQYIETELGKDLMRVIYSTALKVNQSDYFQDYERPLFQILFSFIKEGQENNEIKESVSIQNLQFIIFQGMLGAIYHWCMSDEYYSLKQESEDLFISIIEYYKTKI